MDLREIILLYVLISLVRVSIHQSVITSLTVDKSDEIIGDVVSINCEVTKFALKFLTPKFITSLAIVRQTLNESDFSTLVSLEPLKSKDIYKLTLLTPYSKVWHAHYKTDWIHWITISTRLNLTLRDFQCDDIGAYKCVSAVETDTDLYENTTLIAPVTVDLSFAPHKGKDQLASTNEAKEDVSLTCAIKGPSNIKIVWKFATVSSDENIYSEHDVTFYPATQSNSTSGCATMSYISVLRRTLQKSDNGTNYYCCVTGDKDRELARKQFTVWIQDSHSHNTGVKVSSMRQSLAVLLFIYLLKTFYLTN
ncbi:GATA zinc finger domain-containing protein 15 [Biomphalaria pfeifferi]|uniref:GATA zinc finger domain-containing protein 15 n=1 Tax=Biomphalaria pfeifferi TaxID=112525 RepID=A0AAD8C2F5_BIOPF|nr:GATA zinc finger domain-containing protein 15 [Biomphalaria pfeifferi]